MSGGLAHGMFCLQKIRPLFFRLGFFQKSNGLYGIHFYGFYGISSRIDAITVFSIGTEVVF